MGDGRKDSFIPDAPSQETGAKDSFVPDAVDVKKKDTTGGASVPSPTMSTTPVGRSFASVTTGAKSASASTPSAVKLPNFIYNQNLYTGAKPTTRGAMSLSEGDIYTASITDNTKKIQPGSGPQTYSWSPSGPVDVKEPTETIKTYGQAGEFTLNPFQAFGKTPTIGVESYVEDPSVSRFRYEAYVSKIEEADKQSQQNKLAFAQANPGVNVDTAPLSPEEKAKQFASYYMLNESPDSYMQEQQAVDYWAGKVAENNTVENQFMLQKARGVAGMNAINLYQTANYYAAEIDRERLNNNYSAQIAEIDNIGRQIEEWPKNEEGQPIANSPEDVDKWNALVASAQQISNDKDFMSLSERADKRNQNVRESYEAQKQIIKQNPLWFMAEDSARKAAAQTEVDLEKLGPVFSWKAKNIDNPATQAVVDFAIGVSYVPKAFGGEGYDWTDAIYDKASTGRALSVSPYLPVEDSIVAKTVSAATTMALMVGTGYAIGATGAALGLPTRIGSVAGQVTAGTVATMEGYYRAGIEAGMTESEAESYSLVSGLVQGMLEMVNPEAAFAGPALFKKSADAYMDVIVKGGAKSLARKEAMTVIGKNILGENIQEFTQQIAEWGINMKANQITGANLDVGENAGPALAETAVITTLLSGIVGGVQTGGIKVTENRLTSEATYITGKEPLKYKERVASMLAAGEITQEKAAEINAKIDQAQQIVSKIPSNIPPSEAVDQIPALMEKMRLEEELKKVDPAFKPAVEEQIAQVEKQMQQQAGIVPEEKKDQKAMEADMEELENLRVSKTMMERMGMSLQPEELARLTELENKLTPKEDATQKGIKPEGDQQQYQNGDQTRQEPEAGRSDSTKQGGKIEEEVTASINVAPLYSLKVSSPEQAKAIHDSPMYKEYIKKIADVAKAFGIKIEELSDSIGGFGGVSEASTVLTVSGNFDNIVKFAATIGALSPEVQESTIASQYVEEGSEYHNADQYDITVSDINLAMKAAKEAGFEDEGYTISGNKIIFFDVKGYTSEGISGRIDNFAKRYKDYGGRIETEERRPVRSEYIDSSRRGELLSETSKSSAESRQDRKGIYSIILEASERNKRYNEWKQIDQSADTIRYRELRKKQLDFAAEGKALSNAEISEIANLEKKISSLLSPIIEADKGRYEQAKSEIEAISDEVVSLVSGGFNSKFPIKRPSRAAVKTVRWYSVQPNLIGDGARTNIIVGTNEDADYIFSELQRRYGVAGGRVEQLTTELGYPKRLIEIRTSNGKIAEIQVMTPEAYLAKDGIKEFPSDKKTAAKNFLNKVRKMLGFNIPEGVGHYFYEIHRDPNVPIEIRQEAERLSTKYYSAFLDPTVKIDGDEFKEELKAFRDKVNSADKSKWDEGNDAVAPKSLNDFIDSSAVVDETIAAEEDIPEEVQRLNEDTEALNTLSYAKAAKKAAAVKQRIANAVKSGTITAETGKKYSEQADAIAKQKAEEVKQRVDKAIDEAAETIKVVGEKLGIIGKSYYINPQTGERVEIQKNSLLDPAKLIDIGATMVKRAVAAGIDLNVAINSWAEAVKNHPAYKNLVSTQGQDKADEFVSKAKASFMAASQQVQPPDVDTKMSRIAKTMMESDKVSEEVKQGLQSTGLEYVPQGQKLQAEEADAIIGWHEQHANLEGVLDMVTDMTNGMKPDARAMLATQLYNRYTEMQAQAVTEGNTELATKYAYRAGQALGRANNIISESARALRNAARQIHETLRRYGVEAMVAQMSGMVQGQVQQIMQRGSTKKTIKTATSEIDKFWKMFSSKVPDKTARKSKIDRMVEMAERLDNINGTTEYSDRVKEYQKILAEDAEAKAIDKLMTDLENKLTQVSDRAKRRKIIVNALNELNEKGKLTDGRVKKLVEEALFEQEFTPELQDMLRKGFQIMKDYADLDASRQEAIKKLRDDYTEAMKTATPEEGSKLTKAFRADVKKVYDELVEARFKAEEQHAKIAEQFLEDRGLFDMLRMTLPSNLFTSGGILTNLYFNLADVFPRVARAVMASGMDAIILPIQNRIRAKKGLSPLTRTNRFGAQLMGIHRYGLKYGLKEARFRSLKGIQSVEDMEKFEMRRSLKPIDAAISLFRKKRPNQRMYRYVEDKIAAAIEATSGSFSSILLRAMSLGDVGPREVARFGKLYEIAVTTKGLTEREDIAEFVFHPDEESAKYAEEYAKELVFQKDRNKISLETLTKVMKGESLDGVQVSPDVASQAVQLVGDLIDLPASGIEAHTKGSESEALREAGRYSAEAYRYFATSQFPFKNTYLRMIPRVLEMAWPGMSIAKATIKFMKAAEALNKMDELPDTPANKEARDKLKFAHDMFRNEGLAAVSQAAIATSIAATAIYFVAQGIITGGDDKDELGRQSGKGPYKLNLSALTRIWEGEGWNKDKDGDVWVSYDWFGMNGLVLGATVDKLKKDGQIPGIDANLSILDALNGAGLNILPKSLDMPLIKSSETLLDALRKGDNSWEKWEANTLSAMITGIYPNILQAISRTSDEYDRDIRSGDTDPSKPGVQKSGVDEVGNRLLVSTYRGDKLPPKVDIFGHDIKSTTTGQDWVWRGNAEKTDVNSPNYKLWQLRQQFPPDSPSWRAITPSPLEVEQTFSYYAYGKTKVSKTVSLDPWQLHDLSQQVGLQREQALKMYMSTPQWETDSPTQKAENIEKLWSDATKAGKMHYMMEHPEIISQD